MALYPSLVLLWKKIYLSHKKMVTISIKSEGDTSSVEIHMLNSKEAESIEADPVENQNRLSSDERDSPSSSPLPSPLSCV